MPLQTHPMLPADESCRPVILDIATPSWWNLCPFGYPPGGGLERAYRKQTFLDLASATRLS